MSEKWVYLYSELEAAEERADDWEGVRTLLGGKGANLAEMTRIGVPVPPGFTVTTSACIAYLAADGRFPPDIWEQQLVALRSIEQETGKEFGNPENPLLVSCRSGAKFSMPGMMDTILNLGINDEVAEGLVEFTGDPRFVYDSYRRLVQMFGTVVRGMGDDVFEHVIEQRRIEAGVATDPELGAEDWKALTQRFKELVKITPALRSRRTRSSSSRPRPRPSSSHGIQGERWTTGTHPVSRTTSEPRSTSSRWSSVTWARPPGRAWS